MVASLDVTTLMAPVVNPEAVTATDLVIDPRAAIRMDLRVTRTDLRVTSMGPGINQAAQAAMATQPLGQATVGTPAVDPDMTIKLLDQVMVIIKAVEKV